MKKKNKVILGASLAFGSLPSLHYTVQHFLYWWNSAFFNGDFTESVYHGAMMFGVIFIPAFIFLNFEELKSLK